MMARAFEWLDDRTGVPSAVRHFLSEEIPASAGWHQVFGSIALFCFLTQALTGILLALNYAPTPGDAYNSVRYIMTEVTGGALVRGLHHWGASMMVIVVVLHMIQTFVWGAYKKPREATWMIGVVLLLITMAYALTGYLLPWDNKAYWGTVVTTQIAASTPGAGPLTLHLMGAENGVGVVTFARFYAVHVLVLPPVTLLLIAFHVYLVRRHGITPAPGDELKPKQKFYPRQVFKDTVAVFIYFAILFTLAVAVKAPLGRLADPTDTSYIPRPEWYFLFLFQLLKYMEGPLEIVASVVLPGLAITALLLTPFMDRKAALPVIKRTTAMGVVLLGALGWTVLTTAAIRSTPPEAVEASIGGPPGWRELTPEALAGAALFRQEACASCHAMGRADAGKMGPDLTAGTKREIPWLVQHFKQPAGLKPGSLMPSIQLDDRKLTALAVFLRTLTPQNAAGITAAPAFALAGAQIYQQNQCGMCHQVNGAGQKLGPSLNGLARRRSAEWVAGHTLDPKKYSPGSVMPPYRLSSRDNDHLTRYLMSLP